MVLHVLLSIAVWLWILTKIYYYMKKYVLAVSDVLIDMYYKRYIEMIQEICFSTVSWIAKTYNNSFTHKVSGGFFLSPVVINKGKQKL